MTDDPTQAQHYAWSLGDLGKLAAHFPPIYAELLCEDLDLRPGERVLDAAAGTGTASVAAARRFCEVTAADFVPAVLDRAAELAEGEGLRLTTRVADVQDLPFQDGHFDVVLSTFGVMFAPDQRRAAAELRRVTRAGGRIGVTAWCPDGLIGDYARTIARHVGSPPPTDSPFAWGTEERVRDLLGDARTTRRAQPFRYPSVEFAIDFFAQWYGPARAAGTRLGERERQALRADLIDVWQARNQAKDGTLVAFADYLQAIAG